MLTDDQRVDVVRSLVGANGFQIHHVSHRAVLVDDPVRTEISEPEFHEMLEARSRTHGARIGVAWGEGYRRDEPQAVLDPVHLMGGVSVARNVGSA